MIYILFFFNDTATTEIYTLSLHDALPISHFGAHADIPRLDGARAFQFLSAPEDPGVQRCAGQPRDNQCDNQRSEEHTSELQSLAYLVCRLLLEKKKDIHSAVSPATYLVFF